MSKTESTPAPVGLRISQSEGSGDYPPDQVVTMTHGEEETLLYVH